MSLLMSDLCSFLCFKFHSLNFAVVHAQKKIVMLIRICHTCAQTKMQQHIDFPIEISVIKFQAWTV